MAVNVSHVCAREHMGSWGESTSQTERPCSHAERLYNLPGSHDHISLDTATLCLQLCSAVPQVPQQTGTMAPVKSKEKWQGSPLLSWRVLVWEHWAEALSSVSVGRVSFLSQFDWLTWYTFHPLKPYGQSPTYDLWPMKRSFFSENWKGLLCAWPVKWPISSGKEEAVQMLNLCHISLHSQIFIDINCKLNKGHV